MGLFSDFKMMADTVKDCIDMGKESMRVCDEMEKLIEEARTHTDEKGFLTPNNIKCIKEYDAAKKAYEERGTKVSTEESNKLNENVELKQTACLTSFQINTKFSPEFRQSCKETLADYKEVNSDDKLFDSIENNMLKNYKFKSEEEKQAVHEIFQLSKKDSEACDQMVALIEKARNYGKEDGFLTVADKKAIADYDAAREACDNNKNKKKATDLNIVREEKETACMAAFQKNTKFSPKFRNQCKDAVKLYNDAEAAIEKLKDYDL